MNVCQTECIEIENPGGSRPLLGPEKWYSLQKFCEDLKYEIYSFFRAHALPSKITKVNLFNFVKFQLQSMSSKIERAFEKRNKMFHQNRGKKEIC